MSSIHEDICFACVAELHQNGSKLVCSRSINTDNVSFNKAARYFIEFRPRCEFNIKGLNFVNT